ncbi:DNA polymerase I [Achromobacter phage JWF]|uniref:DNA polymerase I n=1 Tax=Achromobacter phage JWF TaxID=1589748 RepID=UPI000588DFB7|nr:DNA polymerase I [Achromobacter phage JWF]AJD82950.1 DNA polymerase I [Achromobacter phage JWF]
MLLPENKILVDARNIDQLLPDLIAQVSEAKFVGFDIETHDADRHDGLNRFMKTNEEGQKASNTKLVFDVNRTTVTGFSIYADENKKDQAYYINLAHADVENRVPWEKARQIIEKKNPDAYWIIHNANYEWTMMMKSLGHDLGERVLCSMQLCVSAYSPDTYFRENFYGPGLGGIEKILPIVQRVFAGFEPGQEMTNEQEEILYKVIAKESDAEHSYNGFVNAIRIGYDLKRAVKSWFDYDMATFQQTLDGKVHMGQLTGEEVASYGVDDAYWCVKLFHRVLAYIMQTNPPVFQTYLDQEMPFVREASQVWQHGIKMNTQAVYDRRTVERSMEAQALRDMKKAIRGLLPFPDDIHEKLAKYDKWYFDENKGTGNAAKYRKQIIDWANSPDSEDDFAQVMQVRSPVSAAWALEKGKPESKGLNLVHYMPMRVVLYDLMRGSFMLVNGKTQSDGDCRAELRRRWIKKYAEGELKGFIEDSNGREIDAQGEAVEDMATWVLPDELRPAYDRFRAGLGVFQTYGAMAGIAQRVKLYITPYLNLIDPETNRVYPVLSSLLASRRSACATPNGQQLAKFGESQYVRGFFEADDDDAEGEEHILVSADWSAVELVIIGEYSGDAGFFEAYGQRPHRDLHRLAVLGITGMSPDEYDVHPDKKKMRTKIGKVSNFGYWYSGALGTTAKEMGWTSDEMWEQSDKYRNTFPQGEAWRLGVIEASRDQGYVELPDHHRRDRFESTIEWMNAMRQKFQQYGVPAIANFGEVVIKKINRRAGNQAVNSMVQGLCAALAKRKIRRMKDVIKEKGYRARFFLLIHDELVYSVPRSQAVAFMKDLYEVMIEPAGLINNLKLDSSLAVGKTLQPWSLDKAPNGQIELMEIQDGVPAVSADRWGKAANDEERQAIVDYILDGPKKEKKAA